MPRFILIDNNSGFIFADSADFGRGSFIGTPAEFAAAVDDSTGDFNRRYDERPFHHFRNGLSGYRVYRADANGSEAVAVVQDGQDQEVIDAVERDCQEICFIATTEA
jgi:hypothetical protein